MIPTTSAILTWMTNASPTPRTWRSTSPSGAWRKQPDLVGDSEADDGPERDRDDRPEEALAQLAEMVDERHDRVVSGRGGGRRGQARVRCGGTSGDARLEQGVGVGHGLGKGARLACDAGRVGGRRRDRRGSVEAATGAAGALSATAAATAAAGAAGAAGAVCVAEPGWPGAAMCRR